MVIQVVIQFERSQRQSLGLAAYGGCHDFLNVTSVQTLPGCIFTDLSWLSSFVQYLADSYAGKRIQILLFSELARSSDPKGLVAVIKPTAAV
ncbi:hypothetical protein [Microcoleus sp. K5-D4]|uniref:hypothetical protein n=1 Tax=Microcoleus sp. K5-D4 TaxID=2818801 RepID=UPI002FD0B247